MTFLVMANKHLLAETDTLEDAREKLERTKRIMHSFGLGGEAKYYILHKIDNEWFILQ